MPPSLLKSPYTLAGALLLVVVIGYVLMSGDARNTVDPSDRTAYWREEIAQNGSRDAFLAFKKQNLEVPYGEQHLAAHIIGELIYEADGVTGIAVCDAEFGFGCYHGFFGRAISEGGDTRVMELDAACVAAFGTLGTGCQHGIGHGVLEYVGYDRIEEALVLCGTTTEVAPMLGCASGVFMEYNSPLVGSGTGLAPGARSMEAGTLYEPCERAPTSYKDVCYYQLGQWVAASHDDTKKVTEACGTLQSTYRARCFMGAGEGLTAGVSGDRDGALARCAELTAAEDNRSCRAGIAWSLFASRKGSNEARMACADTDPAGEARCIALADLTGGLDPL